MSAGESDDQTLDELRAELMNLRAQLDRERHLRMALEERNRELQARLYPTPTMNHAQQPQMRYQNHKPQVRFSLLRSVTCSNLGVSKNTLQFQLSGFSSLCLKLSKDGKFTGVLFGVVADGGGVQRGHAR